MSSDLRMEKQECMNMIAYWVSGGWKFSAKEGYKRFCLAPSVGTECRSVRGRPQQVDGQCSGRTLQCCRYTIINGDRHRQRPGKWSCRLIGAWKNQFTLIQHFHIITDRRTLSCTFTIFDDVEIAGR